MICPLPLALSVNRVYLSSSVSKGPKLIESRQKATAYITCVRRQGSKTLRLMRGASSSASHSLLTASTAGYFWSAEYLKTTSEEDCSCGCLYYYSVDVFCPFKYCQVSLTDSRLDTMKLFYIGVRVYSPEYRQVHGEQCTEKYS